MDFLDSLDLDTTHKKCHRVRSWYLYEQYKSLEKNQLDAAQRLRDKCYQDMLLKQELKERRARRRLCDQFGLCQSESKIEKTIKSYPSRARLRVNKDDFFESSCELHEENELDDFNDSLSHDSSLNSRRFEDCPNSDSKRNDSDIVSVNSIIKNLNVHKNLADDLKGELEAVKRNIAENINLQLEDVKHNIECLEKYTTLSDSDQIPETENLDMCDCCETNNNTTNAQTELSSKNNNIFSIWSKFVAFAYETVQSSHGNFYNDYASQVMIAVLALDVLRRGISIICHILQPYVCPVKYACSDSDVTTDGYKILSRTKSAKLKNRYKVSIFDKNHSIKRKNSCRKMRWLVDKECHSENKCRCRSQISLDNRVNEMKFRRNSEPWHGAAKITPEKKSNGQSSSVWPKKFLKGKFSEESFRKCRCLNNVVNPILQLTRYIESMVQDIED